MIYVWFRLNVCKFIRSFLSVVCVLMWNCLIGGDIWGDPLKITPKREVSKRSKIAKPLPEADGGAVITYFSTQLTKRSLSQI